MRIITLAIIVFWSGSLFGQINPLKSQFFANEFLVNPAKAGADETGILSTGYSSQWDKIPGTPEILSFTGNLPISDRMGLGITLLNDKAGLISRTSGLVSYSYKVPLTETQSLRFGLGAGILADRLVINDAISPDVTSDPSYVSYNSRHETLFRAAFGVTYQVDKFEIQSSWFNINDRKSDESLQSVDRSGITSTIRYSFGDPKSIVYTPLIGYRQIHGLSDYWDGGINFSYLSKIDFSALYHSNRSVSAGFKFNYLEIIKLGALYNTEPPQVRGVSGGTFEVSLYMPFSIRRNR